MEKLNIENDYETDYDLVFCYPDVEVDKIHYLVLDVLYRDEDLAPHFMAIQDIMFRSGVVFTSPGGSFQRQFLGLMRVLMNSKERYLEKGRSRTLSLISDPLKEKLTPEQIENF